MSGTQYNQDPYQARPEHHLHETNEPFQSVRPTTTTGVSDTGIGRHHDATLGHSAGADEYNTTQGRTAGTGVAGQQYDPYFSTNASSNRPLDVKPTAQGGVAIGGQSDLPLGHADMGDKIIGKTQKVMGKMTKNPELHEKGELRESGGKAAAHGQARAPHD
ncbi:hypothetical protein M378DRAFT_163009 [Amanita muscaria Koide BX008]|uniref:Uncharacterized protein n=1 Tax=Amanita muscaria (strain Koide BX008) TaxID=946122 RepID=A0A0C2SMX4_AMAMK|nr:hypothetical protein M378DRAFT_163009 [Amanita muscaria Koide BX008]